MIAKEMHMINRGKPGFYELKAIDEEQLRGEGGGGITAATPMFINNLEKQIEDMTNLTSLIILGINSPVLVTCNSVHPRTQ